MSTQTKALLEKRLREAQQLKARINQSTQKIDLPTLSEAEIKLLALQIKKVLKKHLH
jgi:hypothetical protein